ncbi:hypothetical protein NG895_02565 [Aeoliella sp. ICT_H6.2]|uniref:Uncharacterized protein n=1 Tax=Aeoliella straminimaris TaxID=2954799 RepID=A0A9X2F5W5_9BACT|nr:hypothetical protein [Aeoliella straminimaris]MCO6042780.1 hypothetical protein [Aeoliella straminimaris]
MSRRKKRPDRQAIEGEAQVASSTELPERWPSSKPRLWMLALSAACVLAWLAVLAYIGLLYGN